MEKLFTAKLGTELMKQSGYYLTKRLASIFNGYESLFFSIFILIVFLNNAGISDILHF